VSPSGSLAVVVKLTDEVAAAGQLPDLEWNPGRHGKVIVVTDAANVAVGAWFGRIAGSRLLR
jgi:hypothetical protein